MDMHERNPSVLKREVLLLGRQSRRAGIKMSRKLRTVPLIDR